MSLARDRFMNYAAALAWGVDLGPDCEFCGRASFERCLGSTICIGRGCAFRSDKTSNRIGVNRRCMISTLRPGSQISIGDRVRMSGAVLGAAESITIGDDVLCGANVTITDTDWHGLAPEERRKPGLSAPVLIHENVWLGLNVVVLKGVIIGTNTVVAAGSVVSKSLPPNVVAGGMPAVPLKSL
jgi:acetyltransferase-like isoleucine patch superfamily enzyme